MYNFVDNFLKAQQDDHIKENFHDIFKTSIKLIINEQFTTIKRAFDGLNTTLESLRNYIKTKMFLQLS